jgi:hypothetical protein
MIIDQKWDLVKEFTIWKLFLPFAIYQLLYFYYSNFIFLNRYRKGEEELASEELNLNLILFYGMTVVLMFYSLYFLSNELHELLGSGWSHFSSVWNYLDIIPPIVIPIVLISDYFSWKYDFIHTMNAITALAMWLKFLYFLRIFKSTGYLIRMIVDVIADMQVFLLVLLLVIIAFSDALYSLSSV